MGFPDDGGTRAAAVRQQDSRVREYASYTLSRIRGEGGVRACALAMLAFCGPASIKASAAASAEAYNPAWATELSWASNELFAEPFGSRAYLEDAHVPWWQLQTAHPIADYDASKLPVGALRADATLDVELTAHRALPGWTVQPTGIDNVYSFTPGSTGRQDRTARGGQNAFIDLGMHPFNNFTADIAAEALGNYDQRYWHPINDENRLSGENRYLHIARGEAKYDDKTFMLRGFEGVPSYSWIAQNDLFQLLPDQSDVEYFRRTDGSLAPKGGELRYKSPLGTLDILGGAKPRWGYGSGVYARYDVLPYGGWENSFVYRNESIPFGDPDERRWALSYNASWVMTDRIQSHAGVIYQPFRLGRTYQDIDGSSFLVRQQKALKRDALGATWRIEAHPQDYVDELGLGYTYLGPVAGDKEQLDFNADKSFMGSWETSAAYMYRQPIYGPVPLLFEGTPSNIGALVSSPRGPDDPFRVDWSNRKAHIISLTLVYNPDPATPFFRYQRNRLDGWNLNPDAITPWTGALQYRLVDYPTNTDRQYYFDANRTVVFDPVFTSGALASSHWLSSFTGLARWTREKWHVTGEMSAGEALASVGTAYTPATNFSKPDTLFVSGGLSADNSVYKGWVWYGQDVWGPEDFQVQQGFAYHKIYEAGLSCTFLRDMSAGFRYVATRMTDEFIGPDTGAFNEYRFFLTYHFGLQTQLAEKFELKGRPLPKALPEASLTIDHDRFTPDGSGPIRSVAFGCSMTAENGALSWDLQIRDPQGNVVKHFEGRGLPPALIMWEGRNDSGQLLAPGTYRLTFHAADLYGNDVTAPTQSVEIESLPATKKAFTTQATPEGLKLTLSARVLFDTDKWELLDTAQEALRQVTDLLTQYPDNFLRVSGHTDSTGSASHNEALSRRRARSVADYLTSHGVQPTRMTVVGYGSRRPAADNGAVEGRLQNRRVEIEILQ